MADYYHTARAAKKQIENTQKENKRNRELRGDTGQNVEHPLNALSIEGRPVKIHATSLEHHSAINRLDGLIPWNGDPDNLIDRFDCRCMLDFYREPASASTNEHIAAGDPKLLQLVQFEAFRDLVKYASKGLPEEEGIEAAQEESLVIRAQARVEATAAFRIQSHQALPGDAAMAAGSGPYSAVGFQYGGAGAEESDDSSSSSGSDDSGSEDNADPSVREEEDAQDVMDEVAEEFGITNYSWRLARALTQEGEEDAKRRMPRKRSNRKRARARARRLAGMGLDPKGQSLLNWHDPLATNAPSAHLVRPRRPSPEARSRSRSPTRRSRHDPLGALRELPTRPSAHTIDRKAFERDDNIIDALPDMPDPAMSGPQPFPAASALQNIRLQQEQQRRERERDRDYRRRSRSRSRDRYRRRSPSPSSKSSSRHRYSRRSRSRSRDRSRYHRRSPSSSRSRSRSPRHRRREESASERLKSAPPPAKAVAPETPAERMKRIIAAQLNKQSSTDSMKGLNKKR